LNSQRPFFSIVIATYNRRPVLERAVASVENQTFSNWELIVVDDASTDDTAPWLALKQKQMGDRLKVHVSEKNRERGYSRNIGIQMAAGLYVGFLDSDDYHLPHHLDCIYSELKQRSMPVALFFTNAHDGFEDGRIESRDCPDLNSMPLMEYLLLHTFNPQRVVVHRTVLESNTFDPEIPGLEDLDLWLRVATKFPVFQIQERSTVYYCHPEAYSWSEKRYQKEILFLKRIMRKKELQGQLPKRTLKRMFFERHLGAACWAGKNQDPAGVLLHFLWLVFNVPLAIRSKHIKDILYSIKTGFSIKEKAC